MDRLLTVAETAAALRLSKQAVYSLVANRELGCVRISDRWIRIPVTALDKYFVSHFSEGGEKR
jgi:excisionase family DNA binding protein